MSKEQYYLDQLKPEYNILTTAGPSWGFKHSELSKAKFTGKNNPMFGKPRSEETKAKISAAKKGIGKGIPRSEETRAQISASNPNSQKIEVIDLEINTKTIYHSVGFSC